MTPTQAPVNISPALVQRKYCIPVYDTHPGASALQYFTVYLRGHLLGRDKFIAATFVPQLF